MRRITKLAACATISLGLTLFPSLDANAKSPTKSPKTQEKAVQTNEAKPKTGFLVTAFDPTTQTLTAPFYGHNVVDIYESVVSRNKSTAKDEFETTEQYHKRLLEFSSKPLTGSITEDSTLVFFVSPKSSYNADTQTMSLDLELHKILNATGNDSRRSIPIAETVQSKKEIGQNAYGSTMEFNSNYFKEYHLAVCNTHSKLITEKFDDFDKKAIRAFKNQPLPFPVGSYSINRQINLPSDEARLSKDSIGLLIICNMIEPKHFEQMFHASATRSSPFEVTRDRKYITITITDVWVINKATGQILSKSPAQ